MDDVSIRLVQQFRSGDPDAANQIFHRYIKRLIRLAHTRISSGLGQRVDAEDVVQSVYRSFFGKAADGGVILQRSGDLWRLLVAITVNKVRKNARFHRQQKRSIENERSLTSEEGGVAVDITLLADDPTPEDAIAATDELALVMDTLNERNRQILELRLQGHVLEEISQTVGRSQRTVRRALEEAGTLLASRLAEVNGNFDS